MISLYLPDEKEIDIITGTIPKDFKNVTCNQVIVTHPGRYMALIRQLKMFKNYLVTEDSKRKFKDVEDEAIKKLGMYGTLSYRRTQSGIEVVNTSNDDKVIATYINPRAELAKLININDRNLYGWQFNETDLFLDHNEPYQLKNLISADGTEDELYNMLEIFNRQDLDSERKAKMLLSKFPNFGTFVLKALECMDFYEIDYFKIQDLEKRRKEIEKEIERRKKLPSTPFNNENIKLYEKELPHILGGLDKEVIEDNYKTLTLARRLNKTLKK